MPVAQLLPLLSLLGILCGEGPSLRWAEAWGSSHPVPMALYPMDFLSQEGPSHRWVEAWGSLHPVGLWDSILD